jgi:hypothetical protein
MTSIIPNANTGSKPVTVSRTRVSKKDLARELYVKYHNLTRDQMIQKFMDELKMPDNSARTYVSVCAKELNGKLGKEYKTRNVNKTSLKREKAFAIYAANHSLTRKEIIEKLKNELGMTYNSAATHCSLAAKAFKASTATNTSAPVTATTPTV